MKFLGKLILWLLVALLLVIVGAWFLLQTHWGARQASAWLSNGTGWQVSFDAMDHDFSSPLHVQLQNVTFGREGKPATLVAKRSILASAPASLAIRCMRMRLSLTTAL
jgi:autotransporter translocation and assembly factor TamB